MQYNPEIKIYERPEMENPVYQVKFGSKKYYIQRNAEMNSGFGWYLVKKNKKKWEIVKLLGWTKNEAIKFLIY